MILIIYIHFKSHISWQHFFLRANSGNFSQFKFWKKGVIILFTIKLAFLV